MPNTAERLRLSAITKTFGDFTALSGVDFDVRRGEVHALVGENGAGKSTLMRVLSGQLAADSGSLVLGGHEESTARVLHRPRPSVGFVEQEGGLVDELSAAENLVLMQAQGFWSRRSAAASRVLEVGASLGQEVNVRAPIGALQIGERQRLEIITVLASGAEVLILDEPTAALGSDDAALLAETIRTFVAAGGSVIYISHKLREVLAIADRVTVLRRGEVVGHYDDTAEVTIDELAEKMIGTLGTGAEDREDLLELVLSAGPTEDIPADSTVVCELIDVHSSARLSGDRRGGERIAGLNLTVRAGEVVGVAGVVGSGQQALADILAGLRAIDGGSYRKPDGVIGYIPENRKRDALAVRMSLRDNLLVHAHRYGRLGRGPWLDSAAAMKFADAIVSAFNVRTPSTSVAASALSGGNQQRAVVGRELEREPALVVAHNPFRGLDVRAIRDVKESLEKAAHSGAGVVVISPDLDEILQLATRVVVLFDGRIVGEVDPAEIDVEQMGRLMGGVA